MDTAAKSWITFTPSNFHFYQDEVRFAGLEVMNASIKQPEKLMDAIQNFSEPHHIAGAQGWFRLVEQVARDFSRADFIALFWHLL